MNEETKLKNNHFFEFYNERLEFIKKNCTNRIEGTILICCYLDALAGYRYGISSSKKNFSKFVIDYSNQNKIWDKISLILLRQHLEFKNDDYYDKIISFLNDQGAITSNFINLDYNPDLSMDDFYVKAESVLESRYLNSLKSDISKFQYITILWDNYRNQSVHNTSIGIDNAMNIAEKEEPYYSNQHILEENKIINTKTCFGIPQSFLVTTFENCINTFKSYVLENDFAIQSLSKIDKKPNKKSKQSKSDKIPVLITKPFRSFLNDSGNLLEQAKLSHDKFKETNDREDRWLEGAYARSAIISSVFFIENIIENIYKDFSVRESWQFPLAQQKKHQLENKEFSLLPLIDKMFLIPFYCSEEKDVFVIEYFNKGSTSFQELREIIKIRNQFAHSKSINRKMEFLNTENDDKIINDNFSDNYWPFTNLPYDIFIIDYNHAKFVKIRIDKFVEELNSILNGKIVKNSWLTNETIDFNSK